MVLVLSNTSSDGFQPPKTVRQTPEMRPQDWKPLPPPALKPETRRFSGLWHWHLTRGLLSLSYKGRKINHQTWGL